MRENWLRRGLFAAMGAWIGGVLAAAVGAAAVLSGVGPWWAGIAVGGVSGVVGGFAGASKTYHRSMHDRFHGPVGVVLFVGAPIALLVAVLVAFVLVDGVPEGVSSALFAGAVCATLGGGATLVANMPLWKRVLQSESTLHASWRARQPPSQRRTTKRAGAVLAAFAVGYLALSLTGAYDVSTSTWLLVLGPIVAVLGTVNHERDVEVRDGGVLVESTLVAWDDLAGFELTDEALVLHRESRWFERADRFDRADVADLDAAVEALERFLERRDR